jgi:hypothetical protein
MFSRDADRVDYHQTVGKPLSRAGGSVDWDGGEIVAFRMHLPSEIIFENSPEAVRRGNIPEWEQPLAARGEAGVRHVLEVMKADIDTALGLTGQTSVAALDRSALYQTGAPLAPASPVRSWLRG